MGDYFWGWYFKCQSEGGTLAVIPALHRAGEERSCSIQLITGDGAWNVSYPYDHFQKGRGRVSIGENRFGAEGVRLNLHTPQLTADGELRFGPLTRIRYDIMGPFACVPFMECRHSVLSMGHTVDGTLTVNGRAYHFQSGMGYWEGDRGRSFPSQYAWTQCWIPGGSLMLSVAEIPLAGFRFTGVIGVVRLRGEEYRLATYLGARAVRIGEGEIVVRQGGDELIVRLLESSARPLRAPQGGAMARTIHESAACRAAYRFKKGGRILLDFETDRASFEYEYGR